jgi:deoxyribonuclease-4
MFGSHLSIAGSMTNALDEAQSLGLDCVQVFTKNQQQWKAPSLKAEVIAGWKKSLGQMAWLKDGRTSPRVVSHASYLANMASPNDELREKSIALMREELERCEQLDIPLLVFHPGAYTTSSLEDGIARIASAVASILKDTAGYKTVMCFENVAGAGSTVGRTFEELATLRARVIDQGGPAQRVGFCIDTCHAHAAGYDLSTAASTRESLDKLLSTLGPETIRCLHLNDSKGKAGSRLDRHEHIGAGTIGQSGFATFLACEHFSDIPKIMETPKGEKEKGLAWDTVNVTLLRKLCAAPQTVRPKARARR